MVYIFKRNWEGEGGERSGRGGTRRREKWGEGEGDEGSGERERRMRGVERGRGG